MTIRFRRHRGLSGAWLVPAALILANGAAIGQPSAALGASCPGEHQIVLDRPSITPATGTTETSFTFAVRYRDTANCPPTTLAVQIPGIGNFAMNQGAGKTFRQGVNYARVLNLPPGTWEYAYAATSGTGAGQQTVALKAEKPLVIAGPPSPPPVPSGTPPAQGSLPPGSASPTASRSPGPGGGGSDDGRKPPSGEDAAGFRFQIPAIFGGPMSGVIGPWVILTAIGIGIFWVLLRRRPESPVAAGRAAVPAGVTGSPIGSREDAALPRWLRPSLQAARQAGWGVPPPRAAVRFRHPAAPGVDRREIGYRLVRVADGPDDLGSEEIGRFDRGDQVEILETKGSFVRVRGADGLEGWVHQAAIVSILD